MRKWLYSKLDRFAEGFVVGVVYAIGLIFIIVLIRELVR